MKFIIASPNDPADLTTFLLRHKHSILSLTHDLQELAELIRKHAPHGIFICGPPDESFAKRAIEMVTVVPNQILLLHSLDDAPDVVPKQI
jgi:hypothetical protein